MARLAALGALVVLAGLLVPAQASAVTVPAVHYTAEIKGIDAFVGIVKRGNRFRAHVSDATAKGATLSAWFRGDLGPDGHVSASVHGFGLEADLARGSGTGTVTLPDGRSLGFRADSGFGGALIERSYRHAGERYLSGWIVLRDKRVRGRTSVPGTALDGSSATGPGIRPSPPIGSQIPEDERPALCAQLKEDREAVRTQRGRLLHQSGRWEVRLNRGRGSGAAYSRLFRAIEALDMTLEEVERYRDSVC
jgi:hypothetical protein